MNPDIQTFDTEEEVHCIPSKPIFESDDLTSLLDINKQQLSRIRKGGKHLRNIPGITGRVLVPRAEVVRFVTLPEINTETN